MSNEQDQKFEIPDVSTNLSYFVGQYVKIRDNKAKLEQKHKDELAPFNHALRLLEAGFLQFLNATNSDNSTIKGVGNVYRNSRKSARIEDPAAFRRHVIGAEAWDLLDWKANAPAIKEAIDAAGANVPGVTYSETATVGVRKA